MSESFQLCIISVQDVPASLSVRWIYQLSKYLAWMMALDYLHQMSSAFFLLVCLANCWDRHWFKFKDVFVANAQSQSLKNYNIQCGLWQFCPFSCGFKDCMYKSLSITLFPSYYLFGALIIHVSLYLYSTLTFTDFSSLHLWYNLVF